MPWLTSESNVKDTLGGITIDPELMGHILIPYNWKGIYFLTGVVLSASNLSWRTDLFQVERKAREDGQTIFFTPLNPFGRRFG